MRKTWEIHELKYMRNTWEMYRPKIHEIYMSNTWVNTWEIHEKYMAILPVDNKITFLVEQFDEWYLVNMKLNSK